MVYASAMTLPAGFLRAPNSSLRNNNEKKRGRGEGIAFIAFIKNYILVREKKKKKKRMF